jgi:hypothetical protein
MTPPILMPTAPRYEPLACWTAGQIDRFWSGHPEIFFCGTDNASLPLRDDPHDWMRVVHSACTDLLGRGFNQAYVILDDHPPIARCHAEFLRDSLPAMARELGATSVVTSGFGPLVPPKAKAQKWRGWRIERLPAAEPWKLPLHPALWNLERLEEILRILLARLPEDQHTPWAFERIGSDRQKSGLPTEWLSSCWRLDAVQTSLPEVSALHDFQDRLARLGGRVKRAAARLAGHPTIPDPLGHPRVGPYPCFWSGVMKKGSLNDEYLAYARAKGRPELTHGLPEAFAACG